ncbi:MAG: phosphate ABC transporter permease subunit PstC [Mariprofundales bacterium]
MTTADLLFWLAAGLLPLAGMAYYLGQSASLRKEKTTGDPLLARPGYYGWYAVITLAIPSLAIGFIFAVLHLFHLYQAPVSMILSSILLLAAAGAYWGVQQISPNMNARINVEKAINTIMLLAATISILTTIGIVLSVLFESLLFFKDVSFWSFITGTQWDADTAFLAGAGRGGEDIAPPQFGAVPIFAGTFMITAIAMIVGVPIGLYSAIYLSEYASARLRAIAKPMLEVLAGIPTVVYGFFAAITISPLIVQGAAFFGVKADYTNALASGVVMGVMIIPFMSSLSDDVIHAVPQSLRDGSLALGMTNSETIKHILLPAAIPGIVAAFLLSVSRAIGETMIVVMAAGLRPNLTWNPLEGMTTVTVKIVEALTGDQQFDSLLTLSAFSLGLVLLIITLILNIFSSIIIHRFKKQYALV